MVDAAGPIVLGTRLENSLEPRAWRAITYGKGSWILHMLRRRMGDERFMAMLAEFGQKPTTAKKSRRSSSGMLAAKYLPPKSDDAQLEKFFEQWVYGTGIPALKLSYSVKGKAPNVRVVGHADAVGRGRRFHALVPVEIQTRPRPRGNRMGPFRQRSGDIHGGFETASGKGNARPASRLVAPLSHTVGKKRSLKKKGPELGISGPALREWRWEGTHRLGCCLC